MKASVRQDGIWWIAGLCGAIGIAVLGSIRPSLFGTIVLGLGLFLGFVAIAKLISDPQDGEWLTRYVALGVMVKMVGVAMRYLMVVSFYEHGDSLRYHGAALVLVNKWRALEIPTSTSPGGVGTHFVELITAFLYVPHVPTLFGGFLIFGALSFLGQLALYAAFKRALPSSGLKTFAILIFFTPSLVFWPAAIGKEAVMILAIGVYAVGAAGLLTNYKFRWLVTASLATVSAAVIRPHVGFLMAGSLLVAMVFARRPTLPGARLRRVLLVGAVGFMLLSLLTFAGERYGIQPDAESLERFADEVSRNTSQGGSEIEGSPVNTPFDIPAAMTRLLFRPFPHESDSVQVLLSALEASAFLVLVIWRWRYVWRNLRAMRRYPYLILSTVFLLGFAVAFSPVLNLGILVRQRIQALPFFLVMLVGLGWRRDEDQAGLSPHELSKARFG